ncbi:uncharacterized protein K452DRAFT_136631 [Aplosporella prunicola CBS 121167]|uniref:Uncharacterized protein n=1 Tax=Aplosporella prunicola CBS 121167 TaxID=1176127 RepID=A0A6A6BM68_9PEZI|nr:uncharacterized protein K452DRAFT_136631 [Aplosporella prunicola CBS 121167]KAF2145230.1 hypothetical protein K452DRAFT_136631 [Aplosporella prunicola CBS 121167]
MAVSTHATARMRKEQLSEQSRPPTLFPLRPTRARARTRARPKAKATSKYPLGKPAGPSVTEASSSPPPFDQAKQAINQARTHSQAHARRRPVRPSISMDGRRRRTLPARSTAAESSCALKPVSTTEQSTSSRNKTTPTENGK